MIKISQETHLKSKRKKNMRFIFVKINASTDSIIDAVPINKRG